MYECKLPFNPFKKFSLYENEDVKYLSKWDLIEQNNDITKLSQTNGDTLRYITLPTAKFNIHFREL